MDINSIFVIAALTQWICTHSVSISDVISDDVTFIHKTFPVPPSMRAIIEVDVYDNVSFLRPTYPMVGIYTTGNHTNIKKKCTDTWYGQLRNSNLHFRVRKNREDFRKPKCVEEAMGTIHCNLNITVQDFIPRHFSFSFGFRCDRTNPDNSLK